MKHLTYMHSEEDAPAVLSPSLDLYTVAASRQLLMDLIEDEIGRQDRLPDPTVEPRKWAEREGATVRAAAMVREHLADVHARFEAERVAS